MIITLRKPWDNRERLNTISRRLKDIRKTPLITAQADEKAAQYLRWAADALSKY